MNLEKHFHNRTIQMLDNITKFEANNLQKLKEIATESFSETVVDLNKDMKGT